MTDKLLCPVCDKPIEIDDVHLFYACKNNRCVLHNVGGDLKLWQMFANTMNERNSSYDDNISLAGKLDIAIDALKRIDKQIMMTGIEMTSQARKAIKQITTLKQKDVE